MRWLIIAVCVVLVLALIGYARGERQRNEPTPVATEATVVYDGMLVA